MIFFRINQIFLYNILFFCFWPFIRKGGLIFKAGGSNMQHVTSLSFLLLAYSNYLSHAHKIVPCGETSASPALLKRLAKRQVKFIGHYDNIGGPSSYPGSDQHLIWVDLLYFRQNQRLGLSAI